MQWVARELISALWHIEGKARALAQGALHLDTAAHHFHQLLADRQTQATAAVTAGGAGIALGEGFEQLGQGRVTDANAAVADGEYQMRFALGIIAPADVQGHVAFSGEL